LLTSLPLPLRCWRILHSQYPLLGTLTPQDSSLNQKTYVSWRSIVRLEMKTR
jgi:hypothetical protein